MCIHGISETISINQGTDFLSKIFTDVCKLLKINKINTSLYHPQTNGTRVVKKDRIELKTNI